MPVYYNADKKTWYAMFYAKDYKGVNKKYKKTGFKKKKEAQEYEYEFKKKIAKSVNMSFQSLYELYFEDYSKRHKPTAINTVENFFRLHILPFFGDVEISKINSYMIREWQNEILEKKNENGKPFSENSKANIYAALKSLFNWAAKYQGLNENPCKNLGAFGSKKNRSEMKIWSVGDFEKFIDFLELKNKEKNGKYSDAIIIFKVLFWTGLRIGEVLALTFDDINLEEKFIDVNKTISRINKKEYDEKKEKGYKNDDIIGKTGIEKTFEELLKGERGTKQIEVGVEGNVLGEYDVKEAKAGANIVLTIDSKIQAVTENALKEVVEKMKNGGFGKVYNPKRCCICCN